MLSKKAKSHTFVLCIVLASAALAGCERTATSDAAPAINDLTEHEAIEANIAGSPPDRPIWIEFFPEVERKDSPAPPGPLPPSTDPRDFNGTWQQPYVINWLRAQNGVVIEGARADGFLPYTPDAEKIFNYNLKKNTEGTPVAEAAEYCRPNGVTRIFQWPVVVQFIQREGRIWQVFGERQRIIYLDQDHPKDIKPSYRGHSVGRWDGNTLVVDTIGYNAKTTFLDRVGSPHGPKLHTVERYTKSPDGAGIDLRMHVEDPDFYTQPFTLKFKLTWHPELKLSNNHCEDNPQFIVKGKLYQGLPPS